MTIKEVAREAANGYAAFDIVRDKSDEIADAVVIAVLRHLQGEADVLGPRHFYHFDQYLEQFQNEKNNSNILNNG